jgi:DNA recombination protein RmuC
MEILLCFLAGVLLAVVGAYFVLRSVKSAAAAAQEKALTDAAKIAEKEKEAAVAKLQADLSHANDNLEKAEKQYQQQLDAYKRAQEAADEKLNKLHQQALSTMKEQLKDETSKMLKERQNEFSETSKEKISTILAPLQQEIKSMKESVDKNKDAQTELSGVMKGKIEALVEQTKRTSQSADELTMALKNSHKTQGDWGETRLADLLASFGFLEGRQILSQEYLKDAYGRLIVDDKGKKKRPDVILRLDDKRVVIIDSKMSLEAYLQYVKAVEENDTVAMQQAIEDNLESIKNQIKLLREADYCALVKEPFQTIDYMIMYVPVAGALQLAMANSPSLWHDTMEHNHILLCDDRMLETIIRTIEITWTKIDQLNNQKKIIKAAELVIERVEMLAEHFIEAETAINDAKTEIDGCRKLLADGGNSILKSANDLQKLGVKPAITKARVGRRKKIAGLLEEIGEDVSYEEVELPAIESGKTPEEEIEQDV